MVLGSGTTSCPERSRPAGEGAVGSASPASPTYALPHPLPPIPPTSLTPAVAQPPAPSLQLPVSRAPHSRPGSGCLSAGSAAAWDPWAGAGQASQPVQAEALGPRVIEVLWF